MHFVVGARWAPVAARLRSALSHSYPAAALSASEVGLMYQFQPPRPSPQAFAERRPSCFALPYSYQIPSPIALNMTSGIIPLTALGKRLPTEVHEGAISSRSDSLLTHLARKYAGVAAVGVALFCLATPISAWAYDRIVAPQMVWSAGVPPDHMPGPGNCNGEVPPKEMWWGDDPAKVVKGLVDFYNARCQVVSNCETQHTTTDSVVGPVGYGGQAEPGLYDFGRYTAKNIIHVTAKDCADGRGDRDAEWYIDEFKSCASGGNGERYDPGSTMCICQTGLVWVPENGDGHCTQVKDTQEDDPKACPRFGNPIYPLTGAKRQQVEIDVGLSIPLRLTYDTRSMLPGKNGANISSPVPYSFGPLWGSSFHKQIAMQGPGGWLIAIRGGGISESFSSQSGKYISHSGGDSIVAGYGSGRKHRYTDRVGLLMEQFDNESSPSDVEIATSQGDLLTYTYSAGPVAGVAPIAGLLIAVTDRLGRVVNFNYEQPDGPVLRPRIYRVIDVSGRETYFGYDSAGNLNAITWPDLKVKQFVYERPDLPWALTGIIDEEGKRHASYGYDTEGRATSTEYGGGVEKFSARWSTPPRWQITDVYDAGAHVVWREHAWAQPVGVEVKRPLGTWAALGSQVINGMPRQTSRDQPGGAGCGESTSKQTQDSRGNVLSRLDFGEAGFNRHRTCYAYASDRNIETYRVEGMLESDTCPADFASYRVPGDLPPDKPQRKITTNWHPLWNLEVRRAEPKRVTTTVYNGQPDPIQGDRPDCAAGAPLLPDGVNKIAVVCRRYEQSTDDETGNLGFNAPEKERRVWSYTYSSSGLIKTEAGPRGQQSYEYWPSTAFTGDVGHWQDDLSKVTNALGQETLYLEYNKRGQVLKIQHPNNSIEQREYWPRGWLKTVKLTPAGGGTPEVTEYTYYPTGLLKQATQPDGSWTFYTWDAAHRLTNVKDSAENTVDYDLDDLGNRKSEIYKDPQGALAKAISRTFDALGRMDSSKERQ